MDMVMFSSSVDGSMSNHQNFSRIGGGGDGIFMKPVPPPSFSSGGRPPLLPLLTNSKPYYSYSPLPLPVKRTPNNKRCRRALSSSPPTTNKKPLNFNLPPPRLGPEPSDLPKQVCLKGPISCQLCGTPGHPASACPTRFPVPASFQNQQFTPQSVFAGMHTSHPSTGMPPQHYTQQYM